MSKNVHFYWSLDQLVVETLGVAFVRPYVRTCHTFSRKPLITFYWSLDQLVVETLGVVFVRTFVRSSVRPSRVFSETAHDFFLKLYS